MIGTILGHNDLYIFLENDKEIWLLKKGTVKGLFVNAKTNGRLELSLSDIKDLAKYKFIKDEKGNVQGANVYLHKNSYERLLERGAIGIHLGYSHVNVVDVKQSNNDEMLYESLKFKKQYLNWLIPASNFNIFIRRNQRNNF